MENDDAPVGTILTRREALLAAAKAGLALAVVGVFNRRLFAAGEPTTQPTAPLLASPVLTEGPFFVDEKLKRSDLIAGTKRPSVINGMPLALSFAVYKLSGKTYAPLKDAYVDVWHADTAGVYSDENNPMNPEVTSHETWLRGFQVTDDAGAVQFSTIVPSPYNGRTAHIHFKVRQFSKEAKATTEFTSQVFFRPKDAAVIFSKPPYSARDWQETTNDGDSVYSERLSDGSIAGSRMLLDLMKQPDSAGYRTHFAIVLTEESLHNGSGRGGFGGPGGMGGPGGGPGGPPGPGPDGGFDDPRNPDSPMFGVPPW